MKKNKGKFTIKMSLDEFKSEHKHLLDVLSNPTVGKLKREYKKQKKELTNIK